MRYLLFILMSMLFFSGCSVKYKTVFVSSETLNDNIIIQDTDKIQNVISINKQPLNSLTYKIKLDKKYRQNRKFIEYREFIYRKVRDVVTENSEKFHHRTYTKVYTYIPKDNKFKDSKKIEENGNSVFIYDSCSIKNKTQLCSPKFTFYRYKDGSINLHYNMKVYEYGKRLYGWSKSIRYKKGSEDARKYLSREMTEPLTIESKFDARKKFLNINKKLNLIKTNIKNEVKIIEKNKLKIVDIPSWLSFEKTSQKDTISILLKIKSNDKTFFKDNYSNMAVKKEFHYLIPKFITKKSVNIAFEINSDKVVIPISYYNLDYRIYNEIKRIESLGYGYIKFTSNQNNVDIFIDKLKMGGITKNKPFVAKLPEGKHNIIAKKYLFGSKSININIEADDAFAYHFDLKPSGNMRESIGKGKIVQSTANLTVLSSRNDLEVDIDGAIRIPPFKLPNISTGIYKIKIIGPGIRKTLKIEIIPNKKNVVNLDNLL